MDGIVNLLIENGYWGMLLSAFIAGSFFPFSSEAVFVALLAAGLRPWPLLAAATAGNWGGSMFNYFVSRMGKEQWIERWLHVSPRSMDRARHFLKGRGALMGFFCFLPVLGTALAIALGLMRANPVLTSASVALGKFLRYLIVLYSAGLFIS